jgi:L-aminopeptidase/D-esterase-like protein
MGVPRQTNLTDGITDVPGIRVGWAQDRARLTGCTVVLCEAGAVVGVDVRGAAPATRETDLCRPGTLVQRADAIFLTGGSAFGLDAAAGVMRFLWEQGAGFSTPAGPVPIVPAAAIYDLAVGDVAWPDPDMAYAACLAAIDQGVEQGNVGAGVGATVGKIRGAEHAARGGVGTASARVGSFVVGALMVVNAVGSVVSPEDGRALAGGAADGQASDPFTEAGSDGSERMNTTIGVVATDAPLSPAWVNRLATVAQDALVRVIQPAHTLFDGDTIFGLSTGGGMVGSAPREIMPSLEAAVTDVVVRAVVRAVGDER